MDLKELNQLYDFKGKTVVITGGTGILGAEMACALVGCRANVAIIDRKTELEEEMVKRIETYPGNYIIVFGDVLNRDLLEESASMILEEYGSVDCLINAAGGNHPDATTGKDKSFFDLPIDALRFTTDLNLLGTIIPSQIFGKIMAEKGQGVILNISSMNAVRPLTRIPGYSAAKAAVTNFTQWIAVHMAQEYSDKIRVNALAPGFFMTQQNKFLLTDEKSGKLTERGQKIIDHTPLGRFGDPEELLAAVIWLLSPASSFVTGSVISVDGGFAAYSGV
jgi:NAD(P)-dependent dehydrogenase (short-subunit alcohol dehydrogenase family)